MLLAIDVGNTNIVVGVFDEKRLVVSWRLLTLRERTADEVGLMVMGLFGHERIAPSRIDAVVMGSVVPPLTPIMHSMVKRYFSRDPLIVDPKSNAGMPILYERPAEVGADRIANAIAAHEQYGRLGLPIVVADLGTATTFDAVTAKGEYLGGVICPGPQIAADALFQRAARLPRVDVPPTRCSSARRVCPASTCGSRRASSDGRRLGRSSPACFTDISAWSRDSWRESPRSWAGV
jgi:type III pantothenate kinase